MSAFSLVTWNESTRTTKRQVSSSNTFDFQAINIGAAALPISQSGSGGAAQFNFGGKIVGGAGTPLAATDLGTKGYIDSAIATAVISGGSVKQAILSNDQLSDANGIAAACLFYLTAVAGAGDTFIIKNSAHTETYTFASTASAFHPATGISATNSMSNLASRINTDSVYWSADWIPSAFAEVNAGGTIIIYEKTTAAGASTSRIYGSFASAATAKVVSFASLSEYNLNLASSTYTSNMSPTDPGSASFGFRATISSLTSGEIHYDNENDVLWSWDGASAHWFTLAAGATPTATSGAGGGILGKLTADSNYGLAIAAGVLKVTTDSTSVGFSGGNLTVLLSGSTLDKSAGLKVAAAGITPTELNSSVAGNGLSGGAGSALAVVAADGIQVSGTGVAANYNATVTNDNAGVITAGQCVYETAAGHVNLASASVSGLYGLPVYVVSDATIASSGSGLAAVRPGKVVTGLTGLVPGPVYVGTTPGSYTQDVSGFAVGQCVYQVGTSLNTTSFVFNPFPVIEY